jgi:hypothetical protein
MCKVTYGRRFPVYVNVHTTWCYREPLTMSHGKPCNVGTEIVLSTVDYLCATQVFRVCRINNFAIEIILVRKKGRF